MIFRQLFEPVSSTYTYLLGCEETGQAILIDPVVETTERDMDILRSLGLTLAYTLETHVHADHLTGAKKLKQLVGSQIAAPKMDELGCVDYGVEEGQVFRVGGISLQPLHTPGHTTTHHAYVWARPDGVRVFTGDALLIDGCGRTDFQGGSSEAQFHSIRDKLFALPDETLVYPGHDYAGRFVSSIAQEKKRNPRLGLERTLNDFVQIMEELKLPYPLKMDYAVPGNQMCGICPPNVPEELKSNCPVAEHDQG